MIDELVSTIYPPVVLKGFRDPANAYSVIGFSEKGMVANTGKSYITMEPLKPGYLVDFLMEKDGTTTTMTLAAYLVAYTKYKKNVGEIK